MTPAATVSTLQRLEQWYEAQCDGDWEHANGLAITSLDNPGWRLAVDLADTALAAKSFPEHKRDYDHEKDWIICVVQDGKFQGHCGARQLDAMLQIFLAWAEES